MSWTLLGEEKDLSIATDSMVILAMELDFHYTRLFDVIFLHNLIIKSRVFLPIRILTGHRISIKYAAQTSL